MLSIVKSNALMVAVVAATLSAACMGTASPDLSSPAAALPNVTDVADETSAQEQPEGLWVECPPGTSPLVRCGAAAVPLRHDGTDDGTVDIGFAMLPSSTQPAPLGALIVNLGGPGISPARAVAGMASGDGWLADADPLVNDWLLSRFDIVGVDPRGVGHTGPAFECGDRDEFLADMKQASVGGDTAAGERALRRCMEATGASARLMHTEYAARDLHTVMRTLGYDEISFYGASYGATLGLWYATLFGGSVHAMVLDGALDKNRSKATSDERFRYVADRLAALDRALREALESCADECPLGDDPVAWFEANAHALSTIADDFDGFGDAPALAVLSMLYAKEMWPSMHFMLRDLVAEQETGVLSYIARLQLTANAEIGEWSPWPVTAHINCLDEWAASPGVGRDERLADADRLRQAGPDQWALVSAIPDGGWRYSLCPFYAGVMTPHVHAMPAALDGWGAPIMVIANDFDSLTPSSDAETLMGELENAILIAADHPQHVVYPYDECVVEHVHKFLEGAVGESADCRDRGG